MCQLKHKIDPIRSTRLSCRLHQTMIKAIRLSKVETQISKKIATFSVNDSYPTQCRDSAHFKQSTNYFEGNQMHCLNVVVTFSKQGKRQSKTTHLSKHGFLPLCIKFELAHIHFSD